MKFTEPLFLKERSNQNKELLNWFNVLSKDLSKIQYFFLFHSEQKESMQLLIKHFHILKICSKWRTWALIMDTQLLHLNDFFSFKKISTERQQLKEEWIYGKNYTDKTEYGILFCGYGETNNHKIIIWLAPTWIWRTKLGNMFLV